MKEIQLTQGQVALVDDDDYEWLSQWEWRAWLNPHTRSIYARHQITVNGEHITTLMHRLIIGAGKGQQVDHENHDTLDNQRHNLKLATNQENQRNKTIQRNNASGACGVAWHIAAKKWQAQIGVGGKQKYLGLFVTKEDAIAARQAANIQYGFHINHGSQKRTHCHE